MTTAPDCRTFIASSPWFDGIPAHALDTLAAAAKTRRFDAGSHVWVPGDRTGAVYGVVSGRIRVYQSTETGQEFALIDWEEGAWFGEQCLAMDEPNMLGVMVLAPSEIVVIPRPVIVELGERWPRLYQNLFRDGWNNTLGLYEILSAVLFYPLRARVAGRVLQLMEDHGQRVEDGVLLDIRVSQNDFAQLSMGSRQRVNTIFREWTKQGFIDTRNDCLLIKDARGLAREVVPFE